MRMAFVGRYERMSAPAGLRARDDQPDRRPARAAAGGGPGAGREDRQNSPAAMAATKRALWGALELGPHRRLPRRRRRAGLDVGPPRPGRGPARPSPRSASPSGSSRSRPTTRRTVAREPRCTARRARRRPGARRRAATHTRAEVRQRATTIAEQLVAAGAGPGIAGGGVAAQRPSTWSPRSSACWQVGAVYVPVNPRLTDRPRSDARSSPIVDAGAAGHGRPTRRRRRRRPLGGRAPAGTTPTSPSCSSPRAPPAAPSRCCCCTRACSRCSTTSSPRCGAAARRIRPARPGRRCPTSSRCRSRCGPASTRCSSRSGSGAPIVVMDRLRHRRVRRARGDATASARSCSRRRRWRCSATTSAVTSLAPLRYVRQHHRAAVAAPGPPLPRPLRDRRAQLLRPDRDRRRDRRLERRRLARSRPRQARLGRASARRRRGPRPTPDTGELQVRTPALSGGYADGADARRPADAPTAGSAPATSAASTTTASCGSRAG